MEAILSWILETLSQFNIYVYTIVAPFLEELIAPIPSPVVFGTLGSIAYVKKISFGMLLVLNFIGSLSKTIAGVIIYMVVYRFQDFVSGHFGRFLGWNHDSIEKFGKDFGKGYKGFGLMLFLRALPIMPSALVSFAGGFFHVPLWNYIVATLVGNYIRNALLIWIGYLGVENLEKWQTGLHTIESSLTFIVLISVLCGFYGLRYYRKKKRR